MFALTSGELAMVLFLFALVWGAGLLPRLGEHLAARWVKRARSAGDTGRSLRARDGK
jgi:Sec-independent protein translocase protein TatA